jgi:hypothetical protein
MFRIEHIFIISLIIKSIFFENKSNIFLNHKPFFLKKIIVGTTASPATDNPITDLHPPPGDDNVL